LNHDFELCFQIVEAASPCDDWFSSRAILFDKELKQDPLRLLQRIARNRCVVASWNGSAKDGKLIYAESGHPEHRVYESTDILIVGMDGAGASSLAKKNKEAGQV